MCHDSGPKSGAGTASGPATARQAHRSTIARHVAIARVSRDCPRYSSLRRELRADAYSSAAAGEYCHRPATSQPRRLFRKRTASPEHQGAGCVQCLHMEIRQCGAFRLRELGPCFCLAATPAPANAQQMPPGYGEQPKLPEPKESWLPTIKWSVANEPWKRGRRPSPQPDCVLLRLRKGLKHPRWLHVLPNGDVLVAEAASEPAKSWWPRTIVQNMVQRRSGSIVENANRISLLARCRWRRCCRADSLYFWKGLRQPFGMALIGDQLYVANTDSVVRFPYRTGDTRIARQGHKAARLACWPSLDTCTAGQQGWHQAVRDGRLGQQHRREGAGDREGPRDHPRVRHRQRHDHASSPPACATPTAWRSSPSPARSGQS